MIDRSSLRTGYEAVTTGLAWAAVADLPLFRLTGPSPDAALQRIVTQDVKAISEGQGRLALVLAPKGQFRALMAVFSVDGELLILAPPGRGSDLTAALGLYLALSKCALEPVPAVALAVFGRRWQSFAAAHGADGGSLAAGGMCAVNRRRGRFLWLASSVLGVEGGIVVAGDPEDDLAELRESLAASGAIEVDDALFDLERIRRGFPAWGAELTDDVLPPEVGLETVAVSKTKGCYIGQETMARIETYGHVNRTLVGVYEGEASDDPPPLPLALLPETGERPQGVLTSWALHPELGGVGLAVVRRQYAGAGAVLSGGSRRFRVAPAPLW